MAQSKDFTHMEGDRVKMVDVGAKPEVERTAKAQGTIWLTPETMRLIKSGEVKKGNVLATAQIAGITAVKRTWDMIPLCHQIPVTGVDVHFAVGDDHITVTVEVRSVGDTGVEMEALQRCQPGAADDLGHGQGGREGLGRPVSVHAHFGHRRPEQKEGPCGMIEEKAEEKLTEEDCAEVLVLDDKILNVRIVLVEPGSEGNVGSVCRAMKNFGFNDLWLVRPCRLGDFAKAMASHARDVLDEVITVNTLDEALQGCDLVVGTTGKPGESDETAPPGAVLHAVRAADDAGG